MKRTILFTSALSLAVGFFALGAAQAQGPAGKGAAAGGAQSGQVLLPQQRTTTPVQAQERVTNEYRYEYRDDERDDDYEYGTPSDYRERAGEAYQIRDQWKKMDEVANGLRAEGYQIRKIEMERYGYEADVLDRDGRRFELRLDPISGKIVGSERD